MLPLLTAVAILSGCGVPEASYVEITQHNESFAVEQDAETITVNNYFGLKNALLEMIEEGDTSGTIHTISYSGAISNDLSRAVRAVMDDTPMGAFAVSDITYDYTRVISDYDIHIQMDYTRSAEEIQSVVFAKDAAAVQQIIRDAMETYFSRVIIRADNVEQINIQKVVESIYRAHPEFALEMPKASAVFYPEDSASCIIDIHFSYQNAADRLEKCHAEMEEYLEQMHLLYGSSSSTWINARRLLVRLRRGSNILQDTNAKRYTLENSAWKALRGGSATSYAFAQAYCLLLRDVGIDCQTVTGLLNGKVHSWCTLRLDGIYYYADPSAEGTFLLGNDDLTGYGYKLANSDAIAAPQVPAYLDIAID